MPLFIPQLARPMSSESNVLEAAAAEVVPSSQIGCRGGAEAEQHHQRGAAGVASRRGWNGSAEPSLGAQVKRQQKQGGRARGVAAERSPRLASLASGQG